MCWPPISWTSEVYSTPMAGTVMPLGRAPERAGELLTAGAPISAPAAFPLEKLFEAPVGRVDAFGVGVSPQSEAEPLNSAR